MGITKALAFPGKRKSLNLLASITLLVSAACTSATAPSDLVRTESGSVQGKVEGDAIVFRGIPFAAPPVGDLRWQVPQPVASWSGVRDATKDFTPCAQAEGEVAGGTFNEDCLYLNVTVPRNGSSRPKPVMVWIHGGGITAGTTNTYDMRRMATQGDVILVGIDSRLNIFGYFAFPGLEGSGGFGLLDEQAGLRWIKRNIAAFGGDPNNVTLFGESGGAVRTCAHMTAPGSTGLFHKVILQSGTCAISWPKGGGMEVPYSNFFLPVAEMQAKGADLAAKLGCEGPRGSAEVLACLRRVPAEKLLAVSELFSAASFGNSVLPEEPTHALRTGNYSATPAISGTTKDENSILVSFMQLLGNPMTEERYVETLPKVFGDRAKEVEARYPRARYASAAVAWGAIMTDRMFVCTQLPVTKLLAKRAPTFAYEFADPNGIGLVPFPAGLQSGASHSSELPLLFDITNGNPLNWETKQPLKLSDAQRELGATMIGYWTRFAHSGNPDGGKAPSWQKVDPDAATPHVLSLAPGPNGIAPVDAYTAHQCAFWETFTS